MTTHTIKTRKAIEPLIHEDHRLELSYYGLTPIDPTDSVTLEGTDGTWVGEVLDVCNWGTLLWIQLR